MQTSLFEIFRTGNTSGAFTLQESIESSWKSPSNIALIKYWGKKPGQIPANPSLSMTLDNAFTQTSVKALPARGKPGISQLNGDPGHPFMKKLQGLFDWLTIEIPILQEIKLEVNTENSFPHSTGIASSASGISAFTLCLLEIALKFTSQTLLPPSFYRAASFAARMGSGSACRSIYGGFTVWGRASEIPGSSDLEAVPVTDRVHPAFKKLRDAILIVSSEPKSLASSQGHRLMNQHPFAGGRFQQAGQNFQQLFKALHTGNFEQLATLAENEALSLHALLMSSPESVLLIKPATVELISRIRKARKQGLPLFFTLDAGPNIHVLYQETYQSQVEQFISQDLIAYCENGQLIYDQCGNGPVPLLPLTFNT